MHPMAFLCTCVGLSTLIAVTMAVQGATLYWGRALAPDNPLLPQGMQDAITPGRQTVRNLTMFLAFPSFVIIAFASYQWYLAIGAIVLVLLCSVAIQAVFLPPSSSTAFRDYLLRRLRGRRRRFERTHDARLHELDILIERFELLAIGQEEKDRSGSQSNT